ncbi:NUDIX hydrolase [Rubrobacter xylanophilus DSM 9941]|uniref:NUDIX hydrolase n=1 Tax=Rubrobacter xylanophilus (strain DSM 9941 / JCM 11954 / NBRC 16129 / PRD-1) TaxID=266117 RepID=Q1ASC7_RUBXD|nr:NUDIX hydrolase [Rubrobacter xylanophilus]ABG05701.1 NUDIX hydrolase [Rubrobacter xylanophilus DSM 9941]
MTVRADLVAGLLPVRPDGRVLLLLRPSGTWDPPAGRLAPGERFEEGAVRELYEETGLLVDPQRILATWVGENPGGGRLAAVTYAGRTPGGEVRLSEEHLDYRWATPEEWLELPSWWSEEDRGRLCGVLRRLPPDPSPAPPPPGGVRRGVARASLGAGAVLVDLRGEEPRALLLRRRKPPAGLWENPGGMLEDGEDFAGCARRETLEETGVEAEPEAPWWARVEPWRGPDDPELYAGVGFVARHPGGEVRIEEAAHDACRWVTEAEWRALPTWYTPEESDALWRTVRELCGGRA